VALTGSYGASSAVTLTAPAPNWYDVEIIVFRNLDPAAGTIETWPADPGQPDWNAATALNPPDSTGTPIPYQLLSPVAEQLDDDWTRLKRSHGFEPLLHLTWTQPALDRTNAPAVRIGVPLSLTPTPATAAVTPAAVPINTMIANAPVYGTAKLSTTGSYLHFDLDMVLRGPLSGAPAAASPQGINTAQLVPPAATAAPVPALQFYRLRQDERIEAGKLTYFDHPLFGVIVLVTPVKKPGGN
jgi:hypothetical protein